MQTHLLVSYDICDDRRRRRVMKVAKTVLTHVQKSVFEGTVSDRVEQRLLRRFAKEIDPEEDSVRVYSLCARCRPATEILGVGIEAESDTDIIL